ncbi:MAG: Asp-tRNA(Asn)/Glu-tRNA(Gln) amidotransferase subunit GatB [Candidatus Paceibacterota bacterium]|jgi:aspartyl-tRNA(Asn)/glutamyl-tRNA(Gln) amidotransferase subunit B
MDENKGYRATIGLEIHAELKTKTKMFCDSRNDPEERRPNVNICPVCMAHPGTLPVINKEAVKHVVKVGAALGGTIADFTEFDRKNYFYPDIPKGYQISQYKYPLISGGSLNGVKITRVHLEEDTARSSHDKGDYTLIDFNRAGIPLMELVTEPVVKSAEEASAFARELQLLLRYLGAGDANMEKGEMRVEANISVSKDDTYGTKVEVKNLNSFKVVEKAIDYEIKRQIELIESGGKVSQETRGWNEAKQETFSQRAKESSHDYRYFPDPDLPKLKLSEIPELSVEVLRKEMPELPWERRNRMLKSFGLKEEAAELFVQDIPLGTFFENVVAGKSADFIKLSANYITSDLMSLMKSGAAGNMPSTGSFRALMDMVVSGKLSSRGAKDTLAIMHAEGGNPEEIAKTSGLIQESDEGKLREVVEKIISANSDAVKEYKSGKEASLQFLIGQGMKEAKGSANPQVLKELFLANLK